jgi:hypothetical protein
MATEAKGWEAMCLAAASERDPERLQEIIVELNVLLETRQEELEKMRNFDSHRPKTDRLGRWHN